MIDKSAVGARPRGQSLNFTRHRGFSMIELMMSVVLIAISAALAIPSYRDMVEKRQVTHGAEQIASFINLAQGAAMKNNEVITVSWSRTDSDDWCVGAVSGDTACNCTVTDTSSDSYCQIGTKGFVIDNSSSKDRDILHSIGGDGSYAFDPVRGLMVDLDDSMNMELRSHSGDFRLNLVVNNTGRVILCSDSADHAVPGYEVCEQDVDVQLVEAES
jgi:type IV fimbrial biogenesis protein FimT